MGVKTRVAILNVIFSLVMTSCTQAEKAQVDNRAVSITSNASETFSVEVDGADSQYSSSEADVMPKSVSYDLYDELISKIEDGLINGFKEDVDVSFCITQGSKSYESVGYLQKDLDHDGIDELLLGANDPDGKRIDEDTGVWDSVIYDIFTIKNGELVHVFTGHERNKCFLCRDGLIDNDWSGSAFCWGIDSYSYSEGKIVFVETVFCDVAPGGQGGYYYSDKQPYDDKSNVITEVEFLKMADNHRANRVWLDFKAFVDG